MKILLISLNSLDENTGGGIYLRTIYDLYIRNGYQTQVLCKQGYKQNGQQVALKKTFISDLLSRFLLCPSFLGAYFCKIIYCARDKDIVAFHSSRLGMLVWLIKRIYPTKKIIVHADNVETLLINQMTGQDAFLKKALISIDKKLIPISEKICALSADKLTFITENDKKFFIENFHCRPESSYVVPVLIGSSKVHQEKDVGKYILFTGSFDFFPNQDALIILLKMINELSQYEFVVAGRKLNDFISTLRVEIPKNISFYSDVNSELMERLYCEAAVFICPVRLGSGMKTKIAEALSYNIPVIAHEKSVYGYEKAIEQGVVVSVSEEAFSPLNKNILNTMINSFLECTDEDRNSPLNVFNSYFSLETGVASFKRIVE